MFKKHNVKIEKVSGVTTDENGLLDETATLVGQKLDCIIVYASTNDITKGINSLNTVKKIERKVKNSLPNTRLAFSSLVLQNNKKYFSRKVSDGWENYCSQTKFDFIDNQSQKITFERSSNENKKGNYHVCKQFIDIFAIVLLKFIQLQLPHRNSS